jgi:hypothetical protein
VIDPWSGWSDGNTSWRPELISVEKLPDELWVREKGQSNREKARTPRNALRSSFKLSYIKVKLTIGLVGLNAYKTLTNSECYIIYLAVRQPVIRPVAERETTQTIV